MLKKILTSSEAREWASDNSHLLRPLYFEQDLTAKQIAERFNIHYDNNFQKGLLRELGTKGNGLGGSRPNAGKRKYQKNKTTAFPSMRITPEVRGMIQSGAERMGVSMTEFVTRAVNEYFERNS